MWPCGPCQRLACPGDLTLVDAVVLWACRSGHVEALCQRHLDGWLDNADDDTDMEPVRIEWVDGTFQALVGA